ncbi:MAG: Thymidylate synthase [Parcubacteria group bacterium GW2011_GWA2_43_17]|nr:MAG: Thymidylate synthase [Parcubacteria group bacterium GW2011_GWA2_43_17]KKT92470.1 MAG: Thymidylate synthase [Parcubacteria group bacterium GW2011_GWF2_45_11]KKT97231.1 MAG: Thymidylate synthase [Parcubacteria group bacterium GW2011_GWC2_45_15]OGY93882.1 MAG: hypothetical protein A2260_01220 [Candidatus Komeilibacteria bacterium RIFOXYA2_FULL_45_9]OGY95622.1 MAG: hypothetical protein A3J95_04340 [Candidatus Komeilibacteria bacterium RIFOXYC2_FULL_45_12]HAH04818.1 hypothetical protein [Ca
MNFSIIAAMGANNEIGKNGIMPWDIKADLKHFAQVTIGQKNNAVIMGRKTWESIPEQFRPLKNRLNAVLSRRTDFKAPDEVLHYESLTQVLKELANKNLDEIFIIGGGSLYHEAIRRAECQKIYLTEVQGHFLADTYFPPIPPEFKKTGETNLWSEGQYNFKFIIYEKNG